MHCCCGNQFFIWYLEIPCLFVLQSGYHTWHSTKRSGSGYHTWHRHSTKRSAVTHLVHPLNFLRGGIHGLKRFSSETAQPEVFNTAVRVLTSIPVMHVFISLSSKDRMTRIVHKYAPVRFVVRYGLKEHLYATKL